MTRHVQQRSPIGGLIRKWREDRKISQLALASRADVSARHLSFVETGRSAPSRGMVLRLAEQLDVPLRVRNQMLLAAGYAPVYSESALDTPRLSMIRTAIRKVLSGHDPYPAVVVDGGWNLVEANTSVALLTEDAPVDLLAPPFNVLRFSLHPRGLAARLLNLPQWRNHVLNRLERQMHASGGDGRLVELYQELVGYPATNNLSADAVASVAEKNGSHADLDHSDVFVPLRVLHEGRELSLFSTVTTFGTPQDITVAELHIESFYPADPATEKILRGQLVQP
jgi:transcriptional regulator with XRE-family HTH domain